MIVAGSALFSLAASYGQPGTPSLAQGCTTRATFCYRDTARPGNADEDPMLSPMASWIWFGAAGDSIEISASPGARVATSLGQDRDALHNTAFSVRHRVQNDGVVLVWLAFESQADSLPYALRVRRSGAASSALRPTGRMATLTVV